MFSGLSYLFSTDTADELELAAQHRKEHEASRRVARLTRQYALWYLDERAHAFVQDDREHGATVVEAALALIEALRVQRRRFGADATSPRHCERILDIVVALEGGASADAKARFARFTRRDDEARDRALASSSRIDVDELVDEAGQRRTRIDPLSSRIIEAWMNAIDESAAGGVEGTRVTAASVRRRGAHCIRLTRPRFTAPQVRRRGALHSTDSTALHRPTAVSRTSCAVRALGHRRQSTSRDATRRRHRVHAIDQRTIHCH